MLLIIYYHPWLFLQIYQQHYIYKEQSVSREVEKSLKILFKDNYKNFNKIQILPHIHGLGKSC